MRVPGVSKISTTFTVIARRRISRLFLDLLNRFNHVNPESP